MTAFTVALLAVLLALPGSGRRRVAPGAHAAAEPTGRLAAEPGGRPVQRLSVRRLQGVVIGASLIGGVAMFGVVPGLLGAGASAPLAAAAVARLASRGARAGPDAGLPLTVDLAAAALRAGQPVATALRLAAPSASPAVAEQLRQVGGLLRLGADPAEAWRIVADDPVLAAVAQTATRSSTSGARLALGWEQLAADLRREVHAAAQARAQRAGVWAMAPLGLCFLPAFVCLGVVPTVIGIARGVFAGLA